MISYIGQEKGALSCFFRFENNAHALPPSGKHEVDEVQINFQNFPLRLYCLRLSENIVILFNGGEKTSQTAQGGKTSMAFREACAFTTRIDQAIKDKEIIIAEDHGVILSEDDSDEIILH